jgi:hypothetical protein
MLIKLRDERGIAMVTVILMTFVMATISVAAIKLSEGALSHSALDRKRDQAIQAAQGAVNAYMAAMPTTTKLCNGVGVDITLSGTPFVSYRIYSVHWSNDGTTWSNGTDQTATSGVCTTSSTTRFKSAKKVVVVGQGTAGTAPQLVTRKWQSLVDLTAITGGSTNAFYGNTGLCVVNNPTILHNTSGNDATLYTAGSLNTSAQCGNSNGNGSMVVEGSVYAQGSIGDSGNPFKGCIEGNVWAGGAVYLQNATVGACTSGSYPAGTTITANAPPNPVCNGQGTNTCYFQDSSGNNLGNITAAGGNVTLIGPTMGYGTCIASALEVWDSSSRCSSSRDSGNAYLPMQCAGTVGSGATACGTANAVGLTPPPVSDFPQFSWASSDWQGAYQVVTESSGNCGTVATDIASKIGTGVSGNYNLVFYVSPSCALTIPNNTTYTLRGNVIIVTTGAFTSSGLTVTTNAGSCSSSAQDNNGNAMYPNALCQFDVIVPTDTVAVPSTCTPLAQQSSTTVPNITFGNNTDLSGVDVFLYTPCWLNINQSTNINGQGVAGVINEANHFTMKYHKLVVPGFFPAGYQAAPEFFRECSLADTAGYC